MAAIFYQYDSKDEVIFKGGLTVISSVRFDFLQDLLTEDSMTFVTNVSVQHNDTVQFFLTFDDLVSWFYFGKGIGSISISGVICCVCEGNQDGNTPGLGTLLGTVIPNMRGKAVKMSLGKTTFSGVLTGFSLSAVQDPSPVIEFNLSLALVDSTIPSVINKSVTCDFKPDYMQLPEDPPPFNDATDTRNLA